MKNNVYQTATQIILVLLLMMFGTTGFAQSRAKADSQGIIPKVGFGTKKVVVDLPPKPMFYYQNGKRTDLEQDFGFVGVIFQKEPPRKDFRYKYYKKLGLVVSELREKSLLENKVYVIRLVPGATESKWNIFTQYMHKDSEITYVGRVFKRLDIAGVKTLMVTKGEIRVVFKDQPTLDQCRELSYEFPLTFERFDSEKKSAFYKKRDISIDDLDLANQMFETGRFKAVEPVFIKVKGQALTEEKTRKLNQELMESAPDDIKKQMEHKREEHLKRMQQKMREKTKNEKAGKKPAKQ